MRQIREKTQYEINVPERILTAVVTLLFLIIIYGAVCELSELKIGDESYSGILMGIALFTTGVLILFWHNAFRWIDHLDDRQQRWLTMSLLMFWLVIITILLWKIRPLPNTDSLDDIDTGWYLVSHTLDSDNYYIKWLRLFGNNYLLIIIFKDVIGCMEALGITDILMGLRILNALVLMAGLLLTGGIVRQEKGTAAANKVLLVMIMNPLYYYLVFWVYSASLSIPLMMLGILLIIRMYRSQSTVKKCIYAAALGVDTVIGYYVRPIAVFPVIAFAVLSICGGLSCVWKKILGKGKKGEEQNVTSSGRTRHGKHSRIQDGSHQNTKTGTWLSLAVFAVVCVLMYVGIKSLILRYFADVIPYNSPITRWLYMGSHGDGSINTYLEDTGAGIIMDQGTTSEEYIRGILYCYQKNGILGTLSLWLGKMMMTFSDGWSGITARMRQSVSFNWYLGLLTNKFAFVLAQIFRIALCLGMFLGGLRAMLSKRGNLSDQLALVTMLGGIVFYFLWEVKADYSLPFLPLMSILAAEGLKSQQRMTEVPITDRAELSRKRTRHGHRILRGIPVAVGIVACILVTVNLNTILAQKTTVSYMRIDGLNRGRSQEITAENDMTIKQTFSVDADFNEIRIEALREENGTDISPYLFSLQDENGENVYQTELIQDQLTGEDSVGQYRIRVGQQKAGNYTIVLEKKEDDLASETFYLSHSYHFDRYSGDAEINGEPAEADLSIAVMQRTAKTDFLPEKIRWIYIAMIVFFYMFTAVGCSFRRETVFR